MIGQCTVQEQSEAPLTARQQEVVLLRHECGASIEEIAAWLGISRRAVLYRLRNARRRMDGPDQPARSKGKSVAASQVLRNR
jgi:DNA-directed RNA polymerase specialized sigma24 family protein